MLRRLQPDLPIALAARNLDRARELAAELGTATVTSVDLERADLGFDESTRFSAVVTALRDRSLTTMRFAQEREIPYVALSDGVFELGPTVARHLHRPTAPILLLGHSDGGVPLTVALHFATAFRSVESIELGLLFDPDDPFGPVSAADLDHIERTGPRPLIVRDGGWHWAGPEITGRTFAGVDGVVHQGSAAGLQDVLGLGVAVPAKSVRIDLAEGSTASSRRGDGPSHEAIIEIEGEKSDGTTGRFRYEIVDPEGYAALSARGVAVAVEHLLGLAGAPPPGPGLYFPENLVDPGYLLGKLETFGVSVS